MNTFKNVQLINNKNDVEYIHHLTINSNLNKSVQLNSLKNDVKYNFFLNN